LAGTTEKANQSTCCYGEFRLEANDFNDLRALSEKTKSIIEEQFIFAQSVCELRESRLTDQAFATENRLHVQPMLKP
jgi:hypothetical protein